MGIRNTKDSWGLAARLFHWTVGILILGMLIFGFYLTIAFYPGDFAKLDLVQQHKSVGFVVFGLVILRIMWRAFNPPPAHLGDMGSLQRAVASGVHVALYVLMLAMPLSGWLMVTSSPLNDLDAYPLQIKNMVFGLFEMPDLYVVGDREVSDLFAAIHYYCAIAMAAIVGLHLAGALYHAVVKKDGVLTRMLRGKTTLSTEDAAGNASVGQRYLG
ncbi:MAG: cytochrome b [Pseudomonadota bacterium]